MNEDKTARMESINDAYQQRVDGLEAANEIKTEAAEKAREESGIVSVDQPLEDTAVAQAVTADEEVTDEEVGESGVAEVYEDDLTPDMSWKKDEIVEYIVAGDVEVERDELEKMTKAELLERFTDSEG